MKASRAGTMAKMGTHCLPFKSPRLTNQGRRPKGSAISGQSLGQLEVHEASQH